MPLDDILLLSLTEIYFRISFKNGTENYLIIYKVIAIISIINRNNYELLL
jgi:hypothetical protein